LKHYKNKLISTILKSAFKNKREDFNKTSMQSKKKNKSKKRKKDM